MKSLQTLGWSSHFESDLRPDDLTNFSLGRITQVNKTNFLVRNTSETITCELAGNLLYAQDEFDHPKTGDWVLYMPYSELGIITRVLKRNTCLYRKKPGSFDSKQVLASNIDYAIVVQCLEIGINLRRLERSIVQLKIANIEPIVVINKSDLLDKSSSQSAEIEEIKNKYTCFLLSAKSGEGLMELRTTIEAGKSYVLIGASGVGKSSLLNSLLEIKEQKTSSISSSSQKGTHTTTSRELILLSGSGIIIDTPGTREFGLAHDGEFSADSAFNQIASLAEQCKYHNCTHENESDCAVIAAVEEAVVPKAEYQNFLKLNKELEHYQSNVQERKNKGKKLSKIIKNMKKSGYKDRK
ncbi:MAG: ribosome small subunit-dependent GTPase A [Bacteroidales bacterium]|nr:MAG: ribosome small subunit-dependent GTPase A [Bacteroidales bacterium]